MAGTVMMAGVVVIAGTLAVGMATAGAAAVFSQRLASAADAAALAAADAASGAVSGSPCDRAAELAATGGATVTGCELDGLIVTVTVSAPFLHIPTTAMARAGPPPGTAG